MKHLRYAIEALFLGGLFILFRIMPLDASSATAGWLGRQIGPRLASSRKARRHIAAALPDKTDEEIKAIIRGMWDNLARVVGEYPHIKKIASERVTIIGQKNIEQTLAGGKGGVFFSAHYGNWEIPPALLNLRFDAPVYLMYRAPNNPSVDKMIHYWRTLAGKMEAYPKSRAGGQQAMKAQRNGGCAAILFDQKYKEGVEASFFGMRAMTNPFYIKLAKKFEAPLVPAFIRRIDGANFELTVHAPLDLSQSEDQLLAASHALLEEEIKQAPEQWLWLHRRWADI